MYFVLWFKGKRLYLSRGAFVGLPRAKRQTLVVNKNSLATQEGAIPQAKAAKGWFSMRAYPMKDQNAQEPKNRHPASNLTTQTPTPPGMPPARLSAHRNVLSILAISTFSPQS